MAMIECSECKKEISSTAKACPSCGAKAPRSGLSWWAWIPIAAICLFALVMVIGSQSPQADEKFMAREAIKVCWDDQSKKSTAPDVGRFIASTCEMMERRFRDKYGVSP